ncbi:hypothetical protein P8452_41168 [Trifolium repens]|nr:hypothetical protein P8452_41168 [Trifolium repens]
MSKFSFLKFSDGKISLEEYKAAAKALDKGIDDADAVKAFKAMDSDKDGFIDFKEFMEMFNGEGVDGDGDGLIDLNEFTRMMINGKKLLA